METAQPSSAPAPQIVLRTLLGRLRGRARAHALTDGQWASAAQLPQETLSRLKKRSDCDLNTLVALAEPFGLHVALQETLPRDLPPSYDREAEESLLDLCCAPTLDLRAWRSAGPRYFMAGVAMLLACARGMDRETLVMLAEALYPGMSSPEVFGAWLKQSPVRPSRFLPMLRQRLARAPSPAVLAAAADG